MTQPATNGLDRDAGAAFVQQIESLNTDLASEKSAYMLRCKPIHEAIQQVLDDAQRAGVRKRAMKVKIKTRDHLRKAAALEAALEDDDRANYELLDDAIPGLDDLPLGIVALEKDRAMGRTRRPKSSGALEALGDGAA
jgi:hypothetical protein